MSLQNTEQSGMGATHDVELALIAESGVLERQAVLLCESIRRFAGRYADSPITVISPRVDRRPSETTLARLAALDVRYLPLDITSIAPEYGSSFRVYAAAELERLSNAEEILFMDSDLLFAGEPDLDLLGMSAAARPVDAKGMCTEGASDPRDRYWTRLSELCGIDFERVPFVETTYGNARVKASYNGGFVLVDRKAGIFGRTLEYFKQSIVAGLAPIHETGVRIRAGHGWVSESGSKLWGSSQACLSLAIWGSGLSVRVLDLSHNFPLHLFQVLSPGEQSTRLRVIHYHHVLDEDPKQNPLLNGKANVSEEFTGWLREALALKSEVEDLEPGGPRGMVAPGRMVVKRGTGMRVMALLAIRNEELFLHRCLEHLFQQGIETCIIDNGSTDASVEIAQSFIGRGVFQVENLPYNGCFDLPEILRRKERLTGEIDADWFMHCDADEIREAPKPYRTLLEGIQDADRQGFNAVNFDEFVFLPTDESQSFEGRDYVAEMQHYYFFEPYPMRRLNAWKNTSGSVDIVSSAGHCVNFAGRSVFPANFILRHYICLSRAHAIAKYGSRVFSLNAVRERGWSRERAGFTPGNLHFTASQRLKRLSGTWDKSDPWLQHENLFAYPSSIPGTTPAGFVK